MSKTTKWVIAEAPRQDSVNHARASRWFDKKSAELRAEQEWLERHSHDYSTEE